MKREELRKFKKYLPNSSTVATGLILGIVAGIILASPALAASGTDPWGNFLTLLTDWVTGNLGKFLALLSISIGAVISLVTHRFQPIAWAIVIGVIIGGAVGIAKLFFTAGGSAFGTSW